MENVTKAEKAQAIIVAAFIVAVGILVLSSLLNGLIFSQDLASRDDGADARTVIEFGQNVEEAVSIAMTGNRTTPSDAEDEFDDYMNLYETELIDRYTSRQRAVSVEPTNVSDPDLDATPAWALGQRCGVTLGSDNCLFVNETGTTDWLVVDDDNAFDGDSPYKLEFVLTRPDNPGQRFAVNITDAGDTFPPGPPGGEGWLMEVNDENVTFLENAGPSGLVNPVSYSWSSDIDGNQTHIEVMNESIDGEPANTKKSLVENSDLTQMNFEGGDFVEGTYDIRIPDSVSESNIAGPCGSTPDVCRLVEDGDNRDLYNVGVLHEVKGIKANYTDLDVSHTYEIDETLEQDNMILEDR